MKLRQPVRVTELFQTFRSRLLDGVAPATPQELLSELSHDASVMRSFDQAPPNTEAGRFFRIVGALNTTTFHPIALLLHRSAEVPGERRERALHAIQSYLIRRMIMGLSTRGLPRCGHSCSDRRTGRFGAGG